MLFFDYLFWGVSWLVWYNLWGFDLAEPGYEPGPPPVLWAVWCIAFAASFAAFIGIGYRRRWATWVLTALVVITLGLLVVALMNAEQYTH